MPPCETALLVPGNERAGCNRIEKSRLQPFAGIAGIKYAVETRADGIAVSMVEADDDIHELLRSRHHEQAFDRLVMRYKQKVFRLAWSYLRDGAQAEDAAQEAFLRLWRALPEYDAVAGALSTWLYTITRNTCLNHLRIRGNHPALSLEEPAVLQLAESRNRVEGGDLSRLDMRRRVEKLEEPERQIVILFYLEERSIEDVAGLLDMPAGTVKSHLHRARKRLGEHLAGEEGRTSAKLEKELHR